MHNNPRILQLTPSDYLTITRDSIIAKYVPSVTATGERPNCIGTCLCTASIIGCAFIYICVIRRVYGLFLYSSNTYNLSIPLQDVSSLSSAYPALQPQEKDPTVLAHV